MKRDKFLKILGMLILAPIMGSKVSSGLEKKKEPEKSYIADGILPGYLPTSIPEIYKITSKVYR